MTSRMPEDPEYDRKVNAAVAYALRATANAPMSEARLRERLTTRGNDEDVVDDALARCRDQGIVDDEAFARAFVNERLAGGHAPLRIRMDLRNRGLTEDTIDAALAPAEASDTDAAAFDLAKQRAARLRGVDAETAYRRTVSFLARRGYTDGLSRKAARRAVFADREPQRVSER